MSYHFNVLLSAIIAALVSSTTNAYSKELDLYGPSGSVLVISKMELSNKAQISFDGLKNSTKGYYGAFAYSKSGAYSRTTGHNTLKTARKYALRYCTNYLNSGDLECKVIAVLTPQKYSEKGKTTLSKLATKALEDLKLLDGYKALAANNAGYFYPVWGYISQQEASNNALTSCNAHVGASTPKIQKRYPCHVVYESR